MLALLSALVLGTLWDARVPDEAPPPDLSGFYHSFDPVEGKTTGVVHVTMHEGRAFLAWFGQPKITDDGKYGFATMHGVGKFKGSLLAVAWAGTNPSLGLYEVKKGKKGYSLIADDDHWYPIEDPKIVARYLPALFVCLTPPDAAQVEAEAWVMGSVKEFPDQVPEDVRKAVEKLCLDMDLWSDPKPWNWPQSHAGFLQWANNAFQSKYHNADRFPDLKEADYLPDFAVAKRSAAFAKHHHDRLSALQPHDPDGWQNWNNGIWQILGEIRQWQWQWEMIRDARDSSKSPLARRRALHLLRHDLGTDYGNWPPVYHGVNLP